MPLNDKFLKDQMYFTWSKLQKIANPLMKNWGLQKLNLTKKTLIKVVYTAENCETALFAIPNLIFTVSSNIEDQKLRTHFDTNSGLKFLENVKFPIRIEFKQDKSPICLPTKFKVKRLSDFLKILFI